MPRSVARVGGRQPLENRHAVGVVLCGILQLVLFHGHVADVVGGYREVVLPLGVARVGGRQPLEKCQPVAVVPRAASASLPWATAMLPSLVVGNAELALPLVLPGSAAASRLRIARNWA